MTMLYDEILKKQDPAQVAGLSRFFKTGKGQYGEGDKFLGIKVPVTREVVKQCWKSTTYEELETCISSEYHEMRRKLYGEDADRPVRVRFKPLG